MTLAQRLLIIFGGLVVTQLVWLVTDPRTKTEGRSIFADKTYLVQVFLFIPQLISGVFFPFDVGTFNILLEFFGIGIFLVGLTIAVWAKLTMKHYWNMPVVHNSKRQSKLVTWGPFTFSRNPIYLGLVLGACGLSLALRSYFVFLVVFLYKYFYDIIVKEEVNLEKIFGREYVEYKKRVPRFFLPLFN